MAGLVAALAMAVWYIPVGMGLTIGYLFIQCAAKVLHSIGETFFRQYVEQVTVHKKGEKKSS